LSAAPAAAANAIAIAKSVSNASMRWSAESDRKNCFPHESVAELRNAGLLALMVPADLGGGGGSYRLLAGVSGTLGQGCLSTAIIWAMHAQQVLTLAEHGRPENDDVLTSVVRDGSLIASVTSESGTGGQLFTAQAPLRRENDRVHLSRAAPIVSYAAEARYFLVTMRASPDAGTHDVRLAVVSRDDGEIAITGSWDAMGMRGTQSVPLILDVQIDEARVLREPFRSLAVRTFVPAGHVGWTAAWHGAAMGALRRYAAWMRRRNSEGSARLDSDLILSRLADLRSRLDPVGALIEKVALRLDRFRQEGVPAAAYDDPTHQIELNNLKIAGSEVTFGVVNHLIELAGLDEGYRATGTMGLEQLFRDLRSASLMYRNERLRQANGRLLIIENSSAATLWSD
jgi:acyl-CoA dehydrogenase